MKKPNKLRVRALTLTYFKYNLSSFGRKIQTDGL